MTIRYNFRDISIEYIAPRALLRCKWSVIPESKVRRCTAGSADPTEIREIVIVNSNNARETRFRKGTAKYFGRTQPSASRRLGAIALFTWSCPRWRAAGFGRVRLAGTVPTSSRSRPSIVPKDPRPAPLNPRDRWRLFEADSSLAIFVRRGVGATAERAVSCDTRCTGDLTLTTILRFGHLASQAILSSLQALFIFERTRVSLGRRN